MLWKAGGHLEATSRAVTTKNELAHQNMHQNGPAGQAGLP
jgi:hypothetical protein